LGFDDCRPDLGFNTKPGDAFFWNDLVFEYWLRTLGFFIFIEGLISYRSARYEIMGLFRWIMNYRLMQPFFFISLLLVDFANPGLMLYSTLLLLLGLHTFFAFKAESGD
jgi:hypothetical protein